ncbi:hypothetical protein K3495_g16655, partial [Podosphaera aphanis]
MGDFNLHHTRWQPSWPRSPSPGAESFLEWIDEHHLTLLSPIDAPTHSRGNVLDLAFGSGPLIPITKCAVATHIDTTSDHATLLSTVDWSGYNEPLQKLRIDTLDTELFYRLLSTAIKSVTSPPPSPTQESLDRLSSEVTEAIHLAYAGAARRSLGHGIGNPWWNKACKLARQRYKSRMRHPMT